MADDGTDFVVKVTNEAFVVRLVRPDQIAMARAKIAGTMPQGVLSGTLADGDGGFNRDPIKGRHWTWHLVPESVNFPEKTIEMCDGRPSDVENDKAHWINDVKMYCPWAAVIVSEIK